MQRRLAAILAADVVGYSRLMALDEEATLGLLKSCRSVIDALVTDSQGRIFGGAGDSVIAEFPSAIEALRCAIKMQREIGQLNQSRAEERRMLFRIGITVGDVIVEGDNLFGEGVNLAARLEALATAGGICVSDTVFQHCRNKVDCEFDDLGDVKVKNIDQPQHVYRALLNEDASEDEAVTEPEPERTEEFDRTIGLDFSPPDYPSIAVLPFTVMSDDPEQAFFADGVTEDIITSLSKISRLMVVARNSTFLYKGQAVDIKKVGREQGVRFVLEGSVRKAGNRVRVTAQLIEAESGLHRWAERYDRELTDIFAVQDEITREIVTAMDVQLREGEQHRVWSKGTENLEAWECLRLATDLALGGSSETRPKARELLDRAIRLDPNYAIAWAMRAWVHFTEADVGGGLSNDEARDKAQAAAFHCGHRALEIDPDCGEAYGILALTHLNANEHDQALAMTEKAIALSPNSAEILGGVAPAVMRKVGQPERGVALVKKAMRLCPFYRPGLLRALGNGYRMCGRVEEAVLCYRESIKRETGYLAVYVNLASALGELGRKEEAAEAAREVLEQAPDFSIAAYTSGLAFKNPADLELVAEGLRKAGLPE